MKVLSSCIVGFVESGVLGARQEKYENICFAYLDQLFKPVSRV